MKNFPSCGVKFFKKAGTCAVLAFLILGGKPASASDNLVDLEMERINLNVAGMASKHLRWISAEHLKSDHPSFGGLSGLLRRENGFLAIGDMGLIFSFDDIGTRVKGGVFTNSEGARLLKDTDLDAESLAREVNGDILMALERGHKVEALNPENAMVLRELETPAAVKDLAYNAGLEAIEVLADGQLVLIAEGRDRDDEIFLWRRDAAGKWHSQTLPKQDGFRPTGLTQLPDQGDLLLLERYFSFLLGVKSRVWRLTFRDGRFVKQQKLLELSGASVPHDNMEGIAAYKNDAGDTEIALISDNNYRALQRTLLLRFKLLD